jgi:fructokinase
VTLDEATVAGGTVLVVGEALVDVVQRADGTVTEHPGGSPMNVAIGLSRLGRRTVLLTRLGTDERGSSVLRHLEASGVRLAEGSVLPGATATALARLAPDGSATYEFDLRWELGAATLPVDPVAVHTGSIAAVTEPGGPAVRRLLEQARQASTTSYDPNCRPDLMGDPAVVRPQVEALVALCDVVKLSDEDAAWLAPDRSVEELATRWLALGPSVVVLTRGGAGVTAWCGAGRVDVPAPRVQVVDTVGAGDSAMAALLDGLWTHGLLGAPARAALAAIGTDVLGDVVRHAVRVAALTVSRPGADPPTRAELREHVP